jgi:hypothetical protein
MSLRRWLTLTAACGFFLFAAAASAVPADIAGGLHWRLIGPMRAGWATAVAGFPDQPNVYYAGAAGGGVWKTTDAGHTWSPIFDDGPGVHRRDRRRAVGRAHDLRRHRADHDALRRRGR